MLKVRSEEGEKSEESEKMAVVLCLKKHTQTCTGKEARGSSRGKRRDVELNETIKRKQRKNQLKEKTIF